MFDFSPDETTRLLLDTVRGFVRTELFPLEEEGRAREGHARTGRAAEIFAKARALGLYAMNMPAELGGGDLSAVQVCLVEEQFGHTKDILIRRAFGNAYEVLLGVPRRATGSLAAARWCGGSGGLLHRDHRAGRRVRRGRDPHPRDQGRAAAGGLNGAKHFVSDGLFSDFFVVSAVTDPGRRQARDLAVPGRQGDGRRAHRPRSADDGAGRHEPRGAFFDDVVLGPECLLGEPGRGLALIFETLGRVRLAHIGARALGLARRALDAMADHANERRQFGRPIGEFQLVRQMIADSAMEIASARLLMLHTAWRIDRGEPAREGISMVKVQAAETLGRVADRAVQVFGGAGYCKDLPIERIYRDARIFRIYDGTSEIHRGIIARGLLARGVETVLPE